MPILTGLSIDKQDISYLEEHFSVAFPDDIESLHLTIAIYHSTKLIMILFHSMRFLVIRLAIVILI